MTNLDLLKLKCEMCGHKLTFSPPLTTIDGNQLPRYQGEVGMMLERPSIKASSRDGLIVYFCEFTTFEHIEATAGHALHCLETKLRKHPPTK